MWGTHLRPPITGWRPHRTAGPTAARVSAEPATWSSSLANPWRTARHCERRDTTQSDQVPSRRSRRSLVGVPWAEAH
jgi:hypothetical protein